MKTKKNVAKIGLFIEILRDCRNIFFPLGYKKIQVSVKKKDREQMQSQKPQTF